VKFLWVLGVSFIWAADVYACYLVRQLRRDRLRIERLLRELERQLPLQLSDNLLQEANRIVRDPRYEDC